MTRRCSHCSSDGHNSRTCPSRSTTTTPPTSDTSGGGGGGGVRLFGVRLTDGLIMKKSASMGNLAAGHYASSSSVSAANAVLANPNSPLSDTIGNGRGRLEGYVSDDPGHVDRRTDRKRGTPWTEEEHRLFLIGLQKLGKGDWRGIARKYVITRTPTQVASHAQKHFIRQSNNGRRKRRTSLFDMTPDMETDVPPAPERFLPTPETTETNQENSISHSNENLESQPMEVTTDETVKESDDISVQSSYIVPAPVDNLPVQPNYIIPVPVDNIPVQPSYLMHVPVLPAFYPAYVPVPFRFWSPNLAPTQEENPGTSNHQIVRPVPVIPKDPIDVVGMSQLTLTETRNGPSNFHPLSKQPLGSPSRQSAFKPRRSSSVPNLTQAYADAAAE